MEGGLRRNSSSDVTYAVQVCISTIKMTFQETPVVGDMSHEHTRRKEIQEYLRESCCHRIKYIAATFLIAFMWKRPLNNATLANTTHRKPKRVSDGTGTQVMTQMMNKYMVKMIQMELYNVRDPPWEGYWKNIKRIP